MTTIARGLDRFFFTSFLLLLFSSSSSILRNKGNTSWGVLAWGGPTQILTVDTTTTTTTTTTEKNESFVDADARFGSAMAADGDWLAVSAMYEDNVNGKSAGAVYLYRWNDTTAQYEPVTRVLAPSSSLETTSSSSGLPNASTTDYIQFGSSVAISGNLLLVGAPFAQEEAGAAFLFEIDGGSSDDSIQPSFQFNGTIGEDYGLGSAVAIWSDPTSTTNILAAIATKPSGAVYVFSPNGGQRLLPESSNSEEPSSSKTGFGSSLAIQGTVLVVGAPDSETVYIFQYNVGQQEAWTETMRLQPSDYDDDNDEQASRFGHDVAMSQDAAIIVVGAIGASTTYTYQKYGDYQWSQVQNITVAPRNEQTDVRFGWSVALSNTTLAVSAVTQDGVQSINAGAVYLYKQIANANDSFKYFDLDSVQRISAGNTPGVAYDSFGHDVTISGFALTVAAPLFDIEDGLTNDAGAVYVYNQMATFAPTVSPVPTIPPRGTKQPMISMPSTSDVESEKGNSTASPSASTTKKSKATWTCRLAPCNFVLAIIALWILLMS